MCQFEPFTCSAPTHSAGAHCPMAGQAGQVVGPSYRQAYGRQASSLHSVSEDQVARSRSDRRASVAAGSIFGLAFVFAITLYARGERIDGWTAVLAILAVFMPLIFGLVLAKECNAWIYEDNRRCGKPRRGFLRRCSDHQGPVRADYLAIVGLSVATLNVFVALAPFLQIRV
jgi:hypothetical protein